MANDTPSFPQQVIDALERSWFAIARPNQLPPPGQWFIWLLLSGRGFGKTRTLSEFVLERVNAGAAKRVALVAATASDARDVMVEGQSGILACAPSWNRPVYEPSRRQLTWPNGAIATTYSAEEPERLRGPQHDLAAVDELGSWKHPAAWDNLMLGLRLGERPRCAVGTTPRSTRLIRDLVAREGIDVVVTRGSSYENRANLAPAFIDQIIRRYEGTRLGRQELMGELLLDTPGALWRHDQIEALRRTEAPVMRRIVVAIDPSGSGDEDADECGLVACGVDQGGQGWVLADHSGRYQPTEWARRAVGLYHGMQADRIVAETNFGAGMVEATIRAIDPNVPFTAVTASRGKVARAEPISALYEQGKVFHLGAFDALEDEMTAFTSNFERKTAGFSPGRVDALVWALTELIAQPMQSEGIYRLYEQRYHELKTGIPAKREPESSVLPQPGNSAWFAQQAAVTAEPVLIPVADSAPRQGRFLGRGQWEADAPGTPHPEEKSDKRW